MSFPKEANCRGLAPFDLPHKTLQAQWEAQQRLTTFACVTNGTHPLWYSAAAGFPGLMSDLIHIDRAKFTKELDAHQLAFLNYDLDHIRVPELGAKTETLTGLLHTFGKKDLLVGLYGPLSLGLSLIDDQETPIWYDDVVRDTLLEHLRLRCAWLEKTLGELTPATIICLLEPFWNVLYSSFVRIDQQAMLEILEETIQSIQTTVGLAPTGSVEWKPLLTSSMQFFVCQPYQQVGLLACRECLNEYFERGGIIAWALVPATAAELDQTNPEQLVETWDQLLKEGLEQDVLTSRMLSGSFITVASGLRSQPIEVAERALGCLHEVIALIRNRYKLA